MKEERKKMKDGKSRCWNEEGNEKKVERDMESTAKGIERKQKKKKMK